ncbi:MAG: uroporphyrinogen decarboxylase family protein [Bilophila sp.]
MRTTSRAKAALAASDICPSLSGTEAAAQETVDTSTTPRSDTMHGKALIFEVLKGNRVERCPWVPYTGSQIANLKGYTAQEMFQDADKLFECCMEAESQYSPDGMTPMFDLQVEAEILGCIRRGTTTPRPPSARILLKASWPCPNAALPPPKAAFRSSST